MSEAKDACEHAYRTPQNNSLHCRLQAKRGAKWDFCMRQQFCARSGRFELKNGSADCPLLKQE